jgi:signal transduction histidine kinase/CheY-like chemotaxis protein
MPVPTEKLFANASQRRIPSLRRFQNVRQKQSPAWRFSIPHFDSDSEFLFRQERQTEALKALKTTLLLASACFLLFIGLGLFNGVSSGSEMIGCLLIALTLTVLFVSLYWLPHPENKIHSIAKLSAALSVADLSCILLIEANPAFYSEIWIGLLPVYFFTYGQMFMTLAESLTFGLLAMIVLPLSGYLIGVEATALMPSIAILLIVNAFGFCTRYQLETQARKLFQERRKAESNSDHKTQFLRQLSHNLCQPLQALSCYSSVLDCALADRPGDSLRQMADKLGSAIDELNNAFNRILDIANLETGQQLPKLEAVDINARLTALENQFAPQAAKHGLKLKVRLRTRPPYFVYSDACILSQSLNNLVDNAIKYTASGWILITAVKVGADRLKLHVCDSGSGIANEFHSDIFKEFFQAPPCRTDSHTCGQGIGLAYVLKAVERLPEHSLDFYSKPNHGSDFHLYLPVAAEQPQRKSLPIDFDNNMAGSFIFIIDHDQAVLDALSEQLIRWGCLVQRARTRTETLAALTDIVRPPDLLITDFYLDGNETTHDIIAAIRADCGPVPALILSAHAVSNEDKAGLPASTQLLQRPAGSAVLMATISNALVETADKRQASVGFKCLSGINEIYDY